MRDKNDIIVFDFETDGLDPETCQPLEIAAKAFNPYTLEPYPDGEFCSLIKPEDFTKLSEGAMATTKIQMDDLKKAPPARVVWLEFIRFAQRFSKGKKEFTAPIAAGKNIINFDLVIVDRLNEMYAPKKRKEIIFNTVWKIDLLLFYWQWFENNADLPSLRAEVVDEYLGIPTKKTHRAKFDTYKDGMALMRFMKMARKLQTDGILNFKNALADINWSDYEA